MNQEELSTYLEERAALVDRHLEACLPPADALPPALHRAMRYSVFSPGKRLRPVVTLAAAEAAGGDVRCALPAACAVELVHTYSLIHDDLPCMDDAALRRGRPSCHQAFGEATATLAGDALLTLAFAVLAEGRPLPPGVPEPPPPARLLAVAELALAAGTRGMVGGQVLDLEAAGRSLTPIELQTIHRFKTGALFVAAARCGAILAGAGAEALAALTDYARELGLAFQITDDVLDYDGRRVGAGYPAVHGLQESRQLAAEAAAAARRALEPLGAVAAPLCALAEMIGSRAGHG